MIYTEGSDAYLIFNSMGSKSPVPAHDRFTYITKLNDAWDDIETDSLANTSAVMHSVSGPLDRTRHRLSNSTGPFMASIASGFSGCI